MNSSFRSYYDRALPSGALEYELSEAIARARLLPTQRKDAQPWTTQWAIALINVLTGQNQIAIRPKYANGTLQWTVYDPQTDTLQQFDSEQGVRAWLEQRR